MAPRTHRASRAVHARRGRALDGLGLLLAALAGAWTGVASVDQPGARPAPVLALLLAMALLVVVGRRLAGSPATLVPGVVAVAIGGALVLGFPDLLRAGGGPTGYANSNACLAVIGAVAAGAAAAVSDVARARQAWAGLAVLLTVGVVATGSVAASATLGVAALLVVVAVLSRQVALAVAGGLIAVSLLLGTTAAVASGSDLLGLRQRDELRSELWAHALDQVREGPLRGAGPGRYGEPHPVSRDADLRWAHHEYLQQAAEQGIVGLLLLLALAGWVYARLWHGRAGSAAHTLAGAAAVTAVALHAAVDHVLHTAAVPLTLAVLVGWATADPPAPGSPGSPHPRP